MSGERSYSNVTLAYYHQPDQTPDIELRLAQVMLNVPTVTLYNGWELANLCAWCLTGLAPDNPHLISLFLVHSLLWQVEMIS